MSTAANPSTGLTFDEGWDVSGVGIRPDHAAMDTLFRGSDALRRRDVTRNDLRRRHRQVFRDVYIDRGAQLSAATKAYAAWLSTGATLGGLSAAAVLGTKWLDARAPAEIIRADRHCPRDMAVRSYGLAVDEVTVVGVCG